MDNRYLIPANTSRGKLIFNFFRPVDLALVGTGAGITILLLLIFQQYSSSPVAMILILLPFLLSAFLVIPIPNYHNMWVLLQSIYNFYMGRKRYFWRGWLSNVEAYKSKKK